MGWCQSGVFPADCLFGHARLWHQPAIYQMDKSTLDAAFYNSIMSLNKKRYELCNSTFRITEQHNAQIHPEIRDKAREYAKRTYASDVTVLR